MNPRFQGLLLLVLLVAGTSEAARISFSNIGPLTTGLRTTGFLSVRSDSGAVDTNWHGLVRLSSSSPDTVIDPSEMLVIRGRGERSFYVKEIGPVTNLDLTCADAYSSLSFSTNLSVADPETRFNRKTLAVNEVMPVTESDPLYEWIEWYNNSSSTIDLTDLCVYVYDQRSTSTTYHFKITAGTGIIPSGPLSIPPGGYLLFVRSFAAFRTAYPDVYDSIASGTAGYGNTRIVSSEYADNTKGKLSSTGSTIYIASNNTLTAPLVSLMAFGDWGQEEGVSLQRISPDQPVQDRNNWRTSVGGSPGKDDAGSSATDPIANPEKRPLIADEHPVDGNIRIAFKAPRALTSVRLSIVASSGRTAKILEDGLSFTEGQTYERSYDCRTEAGIPLNRGLYFMILTGRDSSGTTVRYAAPFTAGTKR